MKDSHLLLNLIALYFGMVVINCFISFRLWRTYRSPLYGVLFSMWVMAFFVFLYQGLANGNDLALALSPIFGAYGSWVLAKVVGVPFGINPHLRKFLVGCALGTVGLLILYLSLPQAPFYLYAFPAIAGVMGPSLYFTTVILWKNWGRTTVAHKGLLIAGILFYLHQMDFPFLRDVEWFAPYGFTFLILILFAISIFMPLTISEVIASESEKLKLYNQELNASLAVTGAVQALLLPKLKEQHFGEVQHAGFHKSALQSGGDWWWAAEISEGRKLYLVGDVTGHGPGPAMITASVCSIFQTLARIDPQFTLEKLLFTIHAGLRDSAQGRYLITFAALEVNANHTIQWATAGAPPILIRNLQQQIEFISGVGNPLGGDSFTIASGQRELHAGERIFIFTDGIYEFHSSVGHAFGLKKLSGLFSGLTSTTASASRDEIVEKIQSLTNGSLLDDDLTFVVIDRSLPPVS